MSSVHLVRTRTRWVSCPASHVPALKDRALLGPRTCLSVEVSVQRVTSLLTASVHASPVPWAPTSQNQAVSSASPVEEVL